MRPLLALLVPLAMNVACSEPATAPADGGSGGSGGDESPTGNGGDASADGGGGFPEGGGGAQEGGGDGGDGGAKPTVCPGYPVAVDVPDTEAAARADLETFAPDATLAWSSLHGTLSLLTNLNVPLDCSGGDVWAAAWSFFAEHPDLFQVDPLEWAGMPPFPCSAVTGPTVTSTYREELAGIGVQKDVLGLFVSPVDGGVVLTGVSGFYLPVLASGSIATCRDVSEPIIEAVVRDQSYAFSTFQTCIPTGGGTYTPSPNDSVELDGSYWEWDDGTGAVVARRLRVVRLIINDENATPELLASDANCPDETGDDRILGFTIVIDSVTTEIVSVKPGIGCIVC